MLQHSYHSDTIQYLREQGCEDLRLFFEVKGVGEQKRGTPVWSQPSGASLCTAPHTVVPHFACQPLLIPLLSAVIRYVPVGVETG